MSATIQAKERFNFTGSQTKQLRAEGQVPAVVYGKDKEPVSISVEGIDLIKKVREEGKNAVFSLEIENGKSYNAMLYDYQMDALKGELTHIDFYLVDMASEVDVQVSVNVEGESKGEKEGGVLQQTMYEINVRATPGNIPEEISIDASELEIGDSVTVSELKSGKNYEILDEDDNTLVTVLPPQEEDVPEPGEEGIAEGDVEEPEAIKEKDTEEDKEEETNN
ncbi:50S ribosomal protein L25/general stress protein Ctc [Halalkalibacillus halophilus]|uniref:50S ribosomal protein L25/general stress protein Ctc n=1 Tax=Halalkalibacillus halophilus TaxID=392827 RepID=UPI00041B971B|nr:50S ribosomal protein L25/general stress protein Ctc [Halalkalibacillus halophilus]